MSIGSGRGWPDRLAVDDSGNPLTADRDGPSVHAAPARFKALGGAALLLLGLALLGYLAFSLVRDGVLWIAAEQIAATVVDLWAEPLNEPDAREATFRYFMRYSFITPDGRAIARTTRVSAAEWGGLGTLGHGRPAYDAFDDAAVPAAAPIYQEQRHVPLGALVAWRRAVRWRWSSPRPIASTTAWTSRASYLCWPVPIYPCWPWGQVP